MYQKSYSQSGGQPCAIILAGGRGERLSPLTNPRTKPAVPYGANKRIIDIAQSNVYNSGIFRVFLATQYKPHSLARNTLQWEKRIFSGQDQFILSISPSADEFGLRGYQGTAGAIERNLNMIPDDTSLVEILAGDHIYTMDFGQKHEYHNSKKADFTISALPLPIEVAANTYGVLKVNKEGKITEFQEKPAHPAEILNKPGFCWASAGIYTANPDILKFFLEKDSQKTTPYHKNRKTGKTEPDKKKIAEDPENLSTHDFGYDIIPDLLRAEMDVFIHDMTTINIPYWDRGTDKFVKEMPKEQKGYWKDVGKLDDYIEANMELVEVEPRINFFNPEWPIYCSHGDIQPSKDVDNQILFSNGVIMKGSNVKRCVIGESSSIESSSVVNSILFGKNYIERGCTIDSVVMDKNIRVPKGTTITRDSQLTQEMVEKGNWTLSEKGNIIIPKGFKFRGKKK